MGDNAHQKSFSKSMQFCSLSVPATCDLCPSAHVWGVRVNTLSTPSDLLDAFLGWLPIRNLASPPLGAHARNFFGSHQ